MYTVYIRLRGIYLNYTTHLFMHLKSRYSLLLEFYMALFCVLFIYLEAHDRALNCILTC